LSNKGVTIYPEETICWCKLYEKIRLGQKEKKRKNFKELLCNLNALAGELKSKRTCPTRALKNSIVFSELNITISKFKTEKQVLSSQICFLDFRV